MEMLNSFGFSILCSKGKRCPKGVYSKMIKIPKQVWEDWGQKGAVLLLPFLVFRRRFAKMFFKEFAEIFRIIITYIKRHLCNSNITIEQ